MNQNWIQMIALFLIVALLAYTVGISIVSLVDNKIGAIEVKIPKIQVDTHFDVSEDAHQLIHICPKENSKQHNVIEQFEDGSTQLPTPEHSATTEIATGKRMKIGCETDADCNIVNGGDGLNVCKSDGKCYCVSGSGTFCQYGPTNYKDPKDMTDIERRTFKYKFRNNFTLQDYKNWLILYRDDAHHLREHHRDNLATLLRGGNLDEKDIPNIRIKPPMEAADYFAKMYEGGKISVHFPEDNETGPMLPANYGEYSEFIPPENVPKSWITGIVDLYKRPHKDDAKALNFYLRPEVTVGVERELVGEEYLNWVKRHHNLADIRQIQIRKDESINTFENEWK
jgi:hypothetical protein